MSRVIKESRGTEGFLILPFLAGIARFLAPVVLPALAGAAVTALTGGEAAAPPTLAVPGAARAPMAVEEEEEEEEEEE